MIGFVVTLGLGIWLLTQGDTQSLNIVSWVMWSLMSWVLVGLAFQKRKREPDSPIPFLYIGWAISASLVTVGVLMKGATWEFGAVEMVCIFTVLVAIYFWIRDAGGAGLIACALGMFVAGLPQTGSFWNGPAQDIWWLWTGTAIASGLSILGSGKLRNTFNAPSVSSLIYQALGLFVLFW